MTALSFLTSPPLINKLSKPHCCLLLVISKNFDIPALWRKLHHQLSACTAWQPCVSIAHHHSKFYNTALTGRNH